jgi:predicted DNA-binding transcriptional regulator AlpA
MPETAEILPERNEHKRYVTIGFFVHEMLGMRSKNWYYNHLKDEGFPQRVYLPGSTRPALDYDECLAYQQRATKTPPWKPRRRA